MLIIEHDVDATLADRRDRWFDAFNQSGDVYLPLMMIDSGNQYSNGDENFVQVYSSMIDTALARPTGASLLVSADQSGSILRFEVQLSNTSGEILSAANDATLTALVWEEPSVAGAIPLVTAAGTSAITTLADGDTRDYNIEASVGGLNASRIRWVVIADYRPASSASAYDTLQAVAGP